MPLHFFQIVLCLHKPKDVRNVPDLIPQILRTDSTGMPLEWIAYQEAARLISLDMVQYAFGSIITRLHGGINAFSQQQSTLDINAILVTRGRNREYDKGRFIPPLNNNTLFRRDQNLCLYCGKQHPKQLLSRDHVRPLSQGGRDHWKNVVTACKRCNNHKADRTPEQANMKLLAIPFVPNYAEYIYLQGRHIIADQMEFLLNHFPKNSPLRKRVRERLGKA